MPPLLELGFPADAPWRHGWEIGPMSSRSLSFFNIKCSRTIDYPENERFYRRRSPRPRGFQLANVPVRAPCLVIIPLVHSLSPLLVEQCFSALMEQCCACACLNESNLKCGRVLRSNTKFLSRSQVGPPLPLRYPLLLVRKSMRCVDSKHKTNKKQRCCTQLKLNSFAYKHTHTCDMSV